MDGCAVGSFDGEPVVEVGVSADGVGAVVVSVVMVRTQTGEVVGVGWSEVFPMDKVVHFEPTGSTAWVSTRAVTIKHSTAGVWRNDSCYSSDVDGFPVPHQVRVNVGITKNFRPNTFGKFRSTVYPGTVGVYVKVDAVVICPAC